MVVTFNVIARAKIAVNQSKILEKLLLFFSELLQSHFLISKKSKMPPKFKMASNKYFLKVFKLMLFDLNYDTKHFKFPMTKKKTICGHIPSF
jgi:hypothetical protein